jgi:hypothetical protein
MRNGVLCRDVISRTSLDTVDSRVAVAEARGQFANAEEEECPQAKAGTRGLVKAVSEDTSACVTVISKSKSKTKKTG